MTMKTGSAAVAMTVAVMLMLGTVLRGAKAQGDLECLSSNAAPAQDANAVVQQLQTVTTQCCQTSGFCTVVLEVGGAAAAVCGSRGYCPKCYDVGEGLKLVVDQCVQNGAVEGVCSPIDGTSETLYYITSSSNHP